MDAYPCVCIRLVILLMKATLWSPVVRSGGRKLVLCAVGGCGAVCWKVKRCLDYVCCVWNWEGIDEERDYGGWSGEVH